MQASASWYDMRWPRSRLPSHASPLTPPLSRFPSHCPQPLTTLSLVLPAASCYPPSVLYYSTPLSSLCPSLLAIALSFGFAKKKERVVS